MCACVIGVRDISKFKWNARISYPCPKVEYVWAIHFCLHCNAMGGGGGGERRILHFEVI